MRLTRFGPIHLVAFALAALAVVATLTAVRGQNIPKVQLEPASDLLPVPVTVGQTVEPPAQEKAQVAPAPARSRGTGAAQTGTGTTGTATAGQGAGSTGGGNTDVTIQNGTNDTETSSGGSHVNNSANSCVGSSNMQTGDGCP
jgi:hypothetical protein